MKQQRLIARDDMILTNGEIYGKEIFLGDGMNADVFYEISQEEYEKIVDANNNEYFNNNQEE